MYIGMVEVMAVAIIKPTSKQITIHFVFRIFLINRVSIVVPPNIWNAEKLSDDYLVAHFKTCGDFTERA